MMAPAGWISGADDFAIEGVESGDEVYIAVINTDFNESNAGNYLASAPLSSAAPTRRSTKPSRWS